MYNWKINMKSGKGYIIKTKYNKLEDLVKEIFGSNSIQVSTWDLKDVECYDGYGEVDSVAIISTDVSSIEYYCGRNNK